MTMIMRHDLRVPHHEAQPLDSICFGAGLTLIYHIVW